MTIEHFGSWIGYGLWAYILLCLSFRLLSDASKRTRALHRAEWIRRVLAPAGARRRQPPIKKLLQCSRSDVLLEQIAISFARNLSSYGPEERTMLECAVLQILTCRIEDAGQEDAFHRCVILRCIGLTGMRSARIGHFLSACAEGSPLERMWVRSLEETSGPADLGLSGKERAESICS